MIDAGWVLVGIVAAMFLVSVAGVVVAVIDTTSDEEER